MVISALYRDLIVPNYQDASRLQFTPGKLYGFFTVLYTRGRYIEKASSSFQNGRLNRVKELP